MQLLGLNEDSFSAIDESGKLQAEAYTIPGFDTKKCFHLPRHLSRLLIHPFKLYDYRVKP